MNKRQARIYRYVTLTFAVGVMLLAVPVFRAGLRAWPRSIGHIFLVVTLCVLAFGLVKNHPAASKIVGALCLLFAVFVPMSVFNPFVAGDYFAMGYQPPSVPATLLWLLPLEGFLLASAYILDWPARGKREQL